MAVETTLKLLRDFIIFGLSNLISIHFPLNAPRDPMHSDAAGSNAILSIQNSFPKYIPALRSDTKRLPQWQQHPREEPRSSLLLHWMMWKTQYQQHWTQYYLRH